MKTFAELVSGYISRTGLTPASIAEKFDIQAPSLSRMQSGKQSASPETLEKLFVAFKLDRPEREELFIANAMMNSTPEVRDILGELSERGIKPPWHTTEDSAGISVIPASPGKNQIPVYAFLRGGCSSKSDFQGQILGHIVITDEQARQGCCAAAMQGDSMYPIFSDGDIVIIKPITGDFIDGRIYAVLVEGDSQAVIKRIQRDPSGVILLISENSSKYRTREINPEVTPITGIGQVVESRKTFKNGE